jgi:hypothetical protein
VRRARRLAPLLVPSLLALAACAGRMRVVEGRVVDHATGRPVSGAVVTLAGRGWGISDGQLVWDKERSVRAIADADGRFRTPARSGLTDVRAEAEGYVRYDGRVEGPRVEVRLVPRRPANPSLVRGLLEVGKRDGVDYGWVLAERRTTSVRDSADLWPTIGGTPEEPLLVLHAPGGVLAVGGEAFGPVTQPMDYVAEAPLRGYAASVRVRPGDTGVLVVRARDGRVAKLYANPALHGATREWAAGTGAFSFDHVYNRAPGRDLGWQQP